MATKTVQHTPGPWMRQGQWATNRGVAECIEAQDWGIIGAWIDHSNEAEANARLIAAAPEMLELLKGVHEFLQGGGRLNAYSLFDERTYYQAASDIIAKAGGR